jgi:hypothetical protein
LDVRPKLAFLLLLVILAACSTFRATPEEPTTVPATPTTAPEPTLTPTAVTPLVILVVPADMNAEESQRYQNAVYALAQSSGLRFQIRNTFTAADLSEPGLQIVVTLPPDPGIAELAAAAPAIHFLAVNIPDVTAAKNVSIIGSADRPDYAAFLGGYIAAMTADDYRVGLLTQKDTTKGTATETAFINGMEFYCGLCRPAFYYGNVTFPLVVEIPMDAKQTDLPFFADFLIDRKASVIYVLEDVETDEVLNRVTTAGVQMLGTKTPGDESLADYWIVTIQPDFIKAIQQAWPDLLAGNEGKSIPSPLELTNINEGILTPGKQRLASEVLDQLVTGQIDTGANP